MWYVCVSLLKSCLQVRACCHSGGFCSLSSAFFSYKTIIKNYLRWRLCSVKASARSSRSLRVLFEVSTKPFRSYSGQNLSCLYLFVNKPALKAVKPSKLCFMVYRLVATVFSVRKSFCWILTKSIKNNYLVVISDFLL